MQPVYRMSEALWLRIGDMLTSVDPDPPANARALLDALTYRSLTGIAWEELPAAYPPPDEVIAATARWDELGLFDRLAAALHIRLFE